jgi:hypothetical protein
MNDLSVIKSFVALAAEEDAKGGSIQINNGLFGRRVPTGQKARDALVSAMETAISLNWQASGKKEARTYVLRLHSADRVELACTEIAFTPEPVTAQDIAGQGMGITLLALQAVSDRLFVPFDQLKELNGHLRAQVEQQQETIAQKCVRIAELEQVAHEKTDELRRHRGEHAEALRHEAEGKATLLLAQAQADATKRLTDTAISELPKLSAMALRAAGQKKLGSLLDAVASGSTGLAGAVGATEKTTTSATPKAQSVFGQAATARPFPPALEAKVRSIALTSGELAKVCKLFLLLVKEDQAGIGLFEDATVGAMPDNILDDLLKHFKEAP